MQLRNFAILAACVTLNAGCMMAARAVTQRQPDPTRIFDSADTNGDGVITREEFHAARERAFTRLDRNGDGYIDKDDAPSRPGARHAAKDRLAQLVAQLDKDGDGRISHGEIRRCLHYDVLLTRSKIADRIERRKGAVPVARKLNPDAG